jgi:hypothetical protein
VNAAAALPAVLRNVRREMDALSRCFFLLVLLVLLMIWTPQDGLLKSTLMG